MEDDKKKKRNKKKKNKHVEAKTTAENNNTNNNRKLDDADNATNVPSPSLDLENQITNYNNQAQNHEEENVLVHTITQLNESHSQKEAAFRDMIKQLTDGNASHIQKQLTLQETIKHLRTQNESLVQKEAVLETRIAQSLSEKDLWDQKEASLEERIKDLEREKDSWILSERMNKERIEGVEDDMKRLEVKVVDLEHENQELRENAQLTKKKDLNSEMEAASVLVEKLITENAELVEKVNELFIELHGGGHTKHGFSAASEETQSQSEPMEDVPIKDDSFGEIIPIQLEEDLPSLSPLSDAPLIGAPFRFISFVAHYVSGADLVDNN